MKWTLILLLIVFILGFFLGQSSISQTGNIIKDESIVPNITDNTSLPEPEDITNDTEPPPAECPDSQNKAIVTKVIDGDTLDIQDGTRVRMLGINTPEKGQSYFEEATDRLKELVLEKEVCLERDKSDKGKYGRLLRHVFIDGKNVNLLLVREGYANVYFVSPDTKYSEEFEEAEALARNEGLGIWKTSNYTDCIGISFFRYDAEGNDNFNLNDEFVKFKNSCDFAVSMTKWTVKDEATHIYTFPEFVLTSNNMVTLYTGSGRDSADSLYWGSSGAIWNNDGDTLFLWDKFGKFVLSHNYVSKFGE